MIIVGAVSALGMISLIISAIGNRSGCGWTITISMLLGTIVGFWGNLWVGFSLLAGFGLMIMLGLKYGRRINKTGENLDYCHSRPEIEAKSVKTAKLLEFISRTDLAWTPQKLADLAKKVFLKLQECWQNRDYGPMTNLMMAHLHAEHCKQIEGMRRNHEINKMENLAVKAVDIVHVRYTSKANDRQFAALITASARDYYVDDRTGKEIRGDDSSATFQEFWTFHWQDGAFLLGLIEQTRESDALKDEDFFEQFTDRQVESVTGQAVDKTGPAGPWLEKETISKATRIERMLNFLAETDKLWLRQAMLDRARDVFTRFYMAREAGAFGPELLADCFPEIAQYLQQESQDWKQKGLGFEYRNFCVRKVELVLVRNFRDNRMDEYVARISAHAQRVFKEGGDIQKQDEYVTPFDEFWTFGRLDNAWKLKEIVPEGRGQKMIARENIDEDTTKHQLKWYYSKKRTV
ncbi:MAG: TIM44-like domain-containing protein [Planctomycetes bacterium]|nr:TIM44-like domain-containing protein [Planctomycetota bacterium]